MGPHNFGNYLTIHYDDGTPNGVYATYMHLAKNSVTNSGLTLTGATSKVFLGEIIGAVGHTGAEAGFHLHVTYGDSLDPLYSDVKVADGSKTTNPAAGPVSFSVGNLLDDHTYRSDNDVGQQTAVTSPQDSPFVGSGVQSSFTFAADPVSTPSVSLSAQGPYAVISDINLGKLLAQATNFGEMVLNGIKNIGIGLLNGTGLLGHTIYLNGADGGDELNASATDTSVVARGGNGADILIGGSANDVVSGGAGADALSGHAGADIFVFDGVALSDAESSTPAFDRITDYDQGNTGSYNATEGDRIDLSALLSTAYAQAAGQPASSLVRLVEVPNGTFAKLEIDTDGVTNGANWVTIAQLDNLKVGEAVNVVLDGSLPVGTNVTVASAGPVRNDFNDDGDSDLLFQNTNGTPQIWLMNGTGVVSQNTLAAVPASWKVIGSGDFNGDGHADIIWQNSDGTPGLWEMNGTSLIAALTPPAVPPSWHVIATGDFNGDGLSDILWQNTDGTPGLWEMNGTSIVSAATLPAVPPSWRVIGAGDFNGDGKADVLWQNTDGTPAIWEMNGTSIVTAATLPVVPSSWHVIGTSDVNGDGMSDILWQNTDGTVAVWEMNGTSLVSPVVVGNPGAAWQLKNDGPIPTDQMGTGASGAMHLSAPDLASANSVLSAAGGGSVAGLTQALDGQPSSLGAAPLARAGATGFGAPPSIGLLDPSTLSNQHPIFGVT